MRHLDALLAFLVATATAALLTPLAGIVARRVGAMAKPSDRGLAAQETPQLGGLAIFAGALLAAAIWMPEGRDAGLTRAILAAAGLITLVGAIDDTVDLPPIVKLAGQIAAALIAVVAGGVNATDVTIPFLGALRFSPWVGGTLTVIWLVGIMNAVNFIDGVDGLAAGIVAIDGVAFTIIAFELKGPNSTPAGILAAVTAGAALGFLFHNFHPASIFMGDSGANLLGYLLGVVTIEGTLKTNAVIALVAPLVILAVPFLDTGFVVAKRLKYRRKPWSADANHFHHRMARIGFSQRKTVLYMYAWTGLLAGFAVAERVIPWHRHHNYYLGWTILMVALGVVAVAGSVYVVYVLEIFKFRRLRARDLRRAEPTTSEHEIEIRIQREVETGEFETVTP
ncbi:MAG: undecaprenyl/decaprenyl-phosphate alpha-N-acetylglucosaminyl 1-phosphate transferase [Actinomycetota bacterium]|nr:undecaprenyl/decaprenyl-phosphate alpha-N-acetylglucosaminyl 1-phosphate transferase [Actinomycetota bacterium]